MKSSGDNVSAILDTLILTSLHNSSTKLCHAVDIIN